MFLRHPWTTDARHSVLTLVALFAKGGVNQQLESVKTIEKDCCEEKRRKIQHNKQQVSLNNEPTLSIHSLQRFPVFVLKDTF
jgi:hypothetical protein